MPERDLIIRNAAIYDPENSVNGEIADLLIRGGRFVDKLDERKAKIIDAAGMIVMHAGVDIHTHIAGSKLTFGRNAGKIPSLLDTGTIYAKMGYLQVTEPAVYPAEAGRVQEELKKIPILDKTTLLLLGNDEPTLKYAAAKDADALEGHISSALSQAKAYGVKATDPGGAAALRSGKEIRSMDDDIPGYGVTQGEMVSALVAACSRLKLPHPLHLHTSGLGLPGNYMNALKSFKYSPIHLAHLQFYSYGGDSWKTFCSEAEKIASEANRRSDLTFDLGQVIFGEAATVTADEALEKRLTSLGANDHTYTYRMDSGVNSVQWAAGLELALHIKDPWRAFISTDSPNGGPFTSYPKIIAWLLDRRYRDEQLKACHPWAAERTTLPSLDRELTLEEIAIMTRAGPAKRLGMSASLSVGSEANIAVYRLKSDATSGKRIETAFGSAAYTIKQGVIVVKDGQILKSPAGRTFQVKVGKQKTTIEEA
jgi:formylmethanofuran dehydrogenase subunit A